MRFYAGSRPWGDILPRYAFFEPLFADKKVLEVGCGDGSGARFLLEHGAGSVTSLALDAADSAVDDPGAIGAGMTFSRFDGLRLAFDDGSFDLVVDFDLSCVAGGQRLAEIARVLGPGGLLLSAVPNPRHFPLAVLCGQSAEDDGMVFERFVAALQERFGSVSIFGQSPFLGFSIGWMGAEDQDLPLEMDSGLLGEEAEDVAFYVVIAGREAINVESQSLVQLPYAELSREWAARLELPAPQQAGPDLDRLQAELQLAEVKAVDRERFLHDARTRVQEVELELERVREQATKYERGLNAARTQMERKDQETETLRKRIGEVEKEFQASRNQSRDRVQLVQDFEERHEALIQDKERLGRRLADSEALAESLRRQLVENEQVLSRLRAESTRRDSDELIVRRDALCMLLGLDEEHPLNAEDLPSLLRSFRQDKEALQNDISNLRAENDELASLAEAAEERNLSLEGELGASRGGGVELRQELQHLRDEYEEKMSWLQAARSQSQTLEEELSAERKRNAELARELTAQQQRQAEQARRRPDADARIEALREENRGLRRTLEDAGRNLDGTK